MPTFLTTTQPGLGASKAKQINIRVTDEQARLLKQHCNRQGISTQEAVIAALKASIEGF